MLSQADRNTAICVLSIRFLWARGNAPCAWEMPSSTDLAMLFLLLHRFPQFQRILRIFRCRYGIVGSIVRLKDVRMAGDELIYETVAHFVDIEWILRIHGAHLRLENGLQQHVAEFFTHVVAIVRFHGVDVFVGFFQQWFKQACIVCSPSQGHPPGSCRMRTTCLTRSNALGASRTGASFKQCSNSSGN